jgi:phospholipid/cholesterol/gamma-HCH transport system permease protein
MKKGDRYNFLVQFPFTIYRKLYLLFFCRATASAKEWVCYIGELALLWWRTVGCIFTPPFKGYRSLAQAQRIGPGSFIISALVAFFVGMIIALQMAYQMVQLSAELYIPNVIAVALTRELTPVLTALIVAGHRTGRRASGLWR